MTASPLSGAVCAKHEGVPAVEVCTRCGAFLCGECVEYVEEEKPVCASCAAIVRAQRTPGALKAAPFLAVMGLIGIAEGFLQRGRLGLFLWALAIPLGFAGLALSIQHGRRLSKQEGVRQPGFGWAVAGRLLGLLHALASVLLIGSFILFLVSRYFRAP
ncbi:MAG: hypothetical protein AB1938_25035 [Myxococcota bacterium]